MQEKKMVLSSSEPITDGGRKYNFLYFIGGIIGFLIGLFMYGFGAGIFLLLLGAFLAYAIKTIICKFASRDLRTLSFSCTQKIPYAQLIQSLQPLLIPLGMTIERGKAEKGGQPIISYKGIIYDVYYNEDDSFGIWWRLSVAKAFLIGDLEISLYRKVSVAYGIIAYNMQKICNGSYIENQTNLQPENENIQRQGFIICPNCGGECEAGTKFCMKCGSNLETENNARKRFCMYCGNLLKEGDKFCIKCGKETKSELLE